VRHHYAAIRRYRTNGDTTFEGLQAALNSLLPLIREKVVAYYVLAVRVTTEWLKQY
jgi:hypothetical protein